MRNELRRTVLDVGKGDENAKPQVADVAFCESSVSLTINDQTTHIPWPEIAVWVAWCADNMEGRG